ncbi:reverse transcriptase domain-containing protein [Tanacetum coccineum]
MIEKKSNPNPYALRLKRSPNTLVMRSNNKLMISITGVIAILTRKRLKLDSTRIVNTPNLAATTEAITAVLLTDMGNVHKPIYFVSKALKGAEVNYPNLKKVAIALVHVTRRLRRYFQAHTICVLTDQPIRQILLKPKNLGHLAKWAIELGEHEIIYKPRSAIKGQILADFLAESPTINKSNAKDAVSTSKKDNPTWMLFTDGTSSVEESRAGSIDVKAVNSVEETRPTWMDPIISYLTTGTLPNDPTKARKIRIKAPQYWLKQDVFYRKGYLTSWLRCVGPEQASYVLREAHFGSCGAHAGARSIAQKVARLGYYWPTMYQDATKIVETYHKCQRHAPTIRQPQCELTRISSPWPFHQWGIDIVGLFPEAPGRIKYLVVAINYFTKWVEAEPVATITGQKMLQFVWRNIFHRFGISGIIISDNGKQFASNPFREWCEELKIKQNFTSVAHPQANGQTEVTNRTILQGLKTRLDKAKGQWVEELPNVIWAYRTTACAGNGCTPFSLVYGSEAVLPLEISLPTY